jgi:catalase
MRQRILDTQANYHPNSIAAGCPVLASARQGYVHFPEKVSGEKTRQRSESFADHFSQAALFYDSLSTAEKRHLIAALQFEVGKVERLPIRQRVVTLLANVDTDLARAVAQAVGVAEPAPVPKPVNTKLGITTAPSVSQERMPKTSIATRKIAVLVSDGFSARQLDPVAKALQAAGAEIELVSPKLGLVKTAEGGDMEATKNFVTASSILYDAVLVPGGKASVDTMKLLGYPLSFLREAYHHAKAVGATGEAIDLLVATGMLDAAAAGTPKTVTQDKGVVAATAGADVKAFSDQLIDAIRQHRHWDRPVDETMPV